MQLNVTLPASLPSGSLAMLISFPGDQAPPVNLAIQGNIAGTPKLTLSATSMAFGNVTVGQNKELSVVVSNTGTAALTISSAAVSGTGFNLTSASSFTLQPGASQIVTVRYAPTSAGASSGTLTLTSNDPSSPATASLSGTGVAAAAPAIDVSPATLDFGTVTVGQTKDLALTVRNTGNAALNIVSIASISESRP
jgi:uncharacterized membrane protein